MFFEDFHQFKNVQVGKSGGLVKFLYLEMRMRSIFDAGMVNNRVVESGEASAVNNYKKADRTSKKQENESQTQSRKQCKIKVALRRCCEGVL